MEKTITTEQYLTWLKTFDHHKGLRMGQHFCNYFNITEANLFYETDNRTAMDVIQRLYIKFD